MLNNDFTVELGKNKSVISHGAHDEDGWRITLVDTGDRALKGSRLKRIEKYVDGENFMMTYGDGVSIMKIPQSL